MIDAVETLEYAVGAPITAERPTEIRNPEAYPFKVFLRKVRKLTLNADDKAAFVQNVEKGFRLKNLWR